MSLWKDNVRGRYPLVVSSSTTPSCPPTAYVFDGGRDSPLPQQAYSISVSFSLFLFVYFFISLLIVMIMISTVFLKQDFSIALAVLELAL